MPFGRRRSESSQSVTRTRGQYSLSVGQSRRTIRHMATRNRSVPAEIILPHIMYRNVAEAIASLRQAFGFVEHYRYGPEPSGAQMQLGSACIMLKAAGGASPAELGYGTQSLTVFVEDVEGHYARAKAAGATILETPHETEYGEFQYAA